MRKTYKVLSAFIVLIVSILFVSSNTVLADDSGEIGFNIGMVGAENQIDKSATYFDLRMSPGQEETIYVQVNNTSSETSKYTVSVNQAYTNDQGFIDYSDAKKAKNSSAPYPIEDLVSYDKDLELKANETKQIPITIKMPSESYDGQILAGIQVIKQTADSNKKSSSQIVNQYGYILGLKLTETDNEVKRNLKLNSVNVEAKFGNPSVIAQLENPTSDAIGRLKYSVNIVKKGTKDSIYKTTYDNNMEIAPYSTFDFAIGLENQRLISGDYTLEMTVTDAKSNKWEFVEDFSVSKQEADNINSITVDKEKESKSYTLWIVIGILVLVVVLLLILFIVKRKKDEEKNAKQRKVVTKNKTKSKR